MKVTTIKQKSLKNVRLFSMDDRAPCYYAEIERGDNGINHRWKIGCKYNGAKNECIIKMSKFGNIDSELIRSRIYCVDFAIKLVDMFRIGGEDEIRKWIKENYIKEGGMKTLIFGLQYGDEAKGRVAAELGKN